MIHTFWRWAQSTGVFLLKLPEEEPQGAMIEPLFKLVIWVAFYLIQRTEIQVDLKIQGDLPSSPPNAGYQNLRADENETTVIEI